MECYQCYRVIRPATALIKLLALWLQARSQGADEGNKAALPLIWTEHLMYTSLLVIMFTCVPLLNIDLDTIKYDTTRSKQCGMSVPQPANIGYQPIINSLGGKTAAVLVWSGLVWSGGTLFMCSAKTSPAQRSLPSPASQTYVRSALRCSTSTLRIQHWLRSYVILSGSVMPLPAPA